MQLAVERVRCALSRSPLLLLHDNTGQQLPILFDPEEEKFCLPDDD